MPDLNRSIPRIDRPNPRRARAPWDLTRSRNPRVFGRLADQPAARSVRVPGLLLRRVLGLPFALFWPERLGDGTLTPEVLRELDRIERGGPDALYRTMDARVVANRLVAGPPAALDYAADQFEIGNWRPDPAPSVVPAVPRPSVWNPGDVAYEPYLPTRGTRAPSSSPRPRPRPEGRPAPSRTGWAQVQGARSRDLYRLMQQQQRQVARWRSDYRAVAAQTARAVARLGQSIGQRLDTQQERQRAMIERALARDAVARARAQEAAIEADYRRALEELERLERQASRSEPPPNRRAESDKASRGRETASAPNVYRVVQASLVHPYPEATIQRFPAQEPIHQRKQRYDAKTNSRLYRYGLALVSQTYGSAEEGFDVLTALANNVTFADGVLEGSPLRRRYEWNGHLGGWVPKTGASEYYGGVLHGLVDGTLELDVLGFVQDYISMQFEDWLFGKAGQASGDLARYIGRPIGIGAGPAI